MLGMYPTDPHQFSDSGCLPGGRQGAQAVIVLLLLQVVLIKILIAVAEKNVLAIKRLI